jgi:hypothetical protein
MNIDKFSNWLINHGCEIEPPTNSYESIRWKGREVGVIYTSGKFSGPYASDAYYKFTQNKKWEGGPLKVGRKTYVKQKIKLLERDGTKCFLCNQELGEDITVDHLIPLVAKGTNELSNMVLMHSGCNYICGPMSVYKKVRIACDIRLSNKTIDEYFANKLITDNK